ncbi:MAG TPA: NAD-dependent epimerase/dehydratase family protein, partial [Dehalococcoidia bacterium]
IIRDSRGLGRLSMLGLDGRVHVVQGSLTSFEVVERALNEYEIEYCFHLAAQAIVGAANRSPLSTFESNIRGTWMLLEAARQSPLLKGLVFASSDKVYGDQPTLPYTEESPLSAAYPYDVSKLCAETIVRSYAQTFDLPVAVARCANIYGGGDLNWSRLVPGTIRSVLEGERPVVRSDGKLQRDYMHVDDAADAYLTLAANMEREDVGGEVFNFGWGHGYSVLAVVEEILSAAGATVEPVVLGQNKGEIRDQWLSSEKAERVLDWRPTVKLGDGIAEAVAWYRDYLRGAPSSSDDGVPVHGGTR